jgi:hypothetical protein
MRYKLKTLFLPYHNVTPTRQRRKLGSHEGLTMMRDWWMVTARKGRRVFFELAHSRLLRR